jgi:DNA-binding NarL/FixJ family response regulator
LFRFKDQEAGMTFAVIDRDEPHADLTPTDSLALAARAFEQLSKRQREVLDLLSHGLCNKAVADRLDISETTVKAYVSAIMRTFECTNRTQAALIGLSLREGLDIKLG